MADIAKSPKFDTVKTHFDNDQWDTNKVADAVKKNWITADEYEEITGEKYKK